MLVCGLGMWERCLGSGIRCGADKELTWGCGSGIWIRGPIRRTLFICLAVEILSNVVPGYDVTTETAERRDSNIVHTALSVCGHMEMPTTPYTEIKDSAYAP